ncbi:PAC2 family protein [Chloroflexota bacterium]
MRCDMMEQSVVLYAEPKLKQPILIAAWPGMGNVALGAVSYLTAQLQAVEFAEIKPFGFFEPSGALIKQGLVQMPEFPRSRFYYNRGKGTSPDLILFICETQPLVRGYEFANIVMDVAQQFQVTRVYTAAAAPTAIHHTHQPAVWAVASQAALMDYLKGFPVVSMTGGRITGMNGLLLGVAMERDVEATCLLGEIPYYTVSVPNPKSSMAVLNVLTKLLRVEVSMSELEVMAEQSEQQIEQLVSSSEEMAKLAERLKSLQWQPGEAGARPETEGQIRLRQHIEELFRRAQGDKSKADELKAELDRTELFPEYEDRFLDLFKKGDQ